MQLKVGFKPITPSLIVPPAVVRVVEGCIRVISVFRLQTGGGCDDDGVEEGGRSPGNGYTGCNL
jgi:hypothetical protein